MDIPQDLVEAFARKNGTIFVGGDLSSSTGLPNWIDLIHPLAQLLDINWPTNRAEITTDHLLNTIQYYENRYSRPVLIKKLREALDTTDIKPSLAYQNIISLPIQTIFTTNYDDLIEQTLRDAKKRFNSIIDKPGLAYWNEEEIQIIKLYGDLKTPNSLVLTKRDFNTFLTSHSRLAERLRTTLESKVALFLGYNLQDPFFNQIWDTIGLDFNEHRIWGYVVRCELSLLEAEDLRRRGFYIINLEDETFPKDTLEMKHLHYNQMLTNWLSKFHNKVKYAAKRVSQPPTIGSSEPVEPLADEVTFWLEARGYTIHERQAQENWAIDIVAELPEGVHFLVRCVDGEIDIPRVQELGRICTQKGYPLGWIITDKRVSPSAREYVAGEKAIRLFNLADFMRSIFSSYFEYLTRLVQESGILGSYADLACEKPVFDVDGREVMRDYYKITDEYIEEWLSERSKRHLSILGDFGAGKTWFCLHFAYKQLQRYISDPFNQRIPLFISLSEYARSEDISQLITDLLSNKYRVQIAQSGLYDVFVHLNRSGHLLLIFDGFDEMARRMDDQTVVNNFLKLAQVVVPGSKVILTCRTPYFRYSREAHEILNGRRKGMTMIDLSNRPEFEIIDLLPFTEKQILEVLCLRLGTTEGKTTFKKLEQIQGLSDLATRPLLLEMITETIGHIEPRQEINAAELYRLYTDRWLNKIIKEERTIISPIDKLFFMEELAWEMYRNTQFNIYYRDVPDRIRRYFELERAEEHDYFDYDLRTQSFLKRDKLGNYSFIHKSFNDYFVACYFARCLGFLPKLDEEIAKEITWKRKKLEFLPLAQTFGLRSLSLEVRNFLADIITNPAPLWAIINDTKGKTFEETRYTGGNAAALLLVKGESFVQANLSKAVLAGAYLRNSNLTDANLEEAYLRYANLHGSILTRANLRKADITDIKIDDMKPIVGLAWHPTEDYLASGSEDKLLQIWDTKTWEKINLPWADYEGDDISWSKNGKYLSYVGNKRGVSIIDLSSSRIIQHITAGTVNTWFVRFIDNETLVCGGLGSYLTWWIWRKEKELRTYPVEIGISAMTLSQDKHSLAIATYKKEVEILNLTTGKRIKVIPIGKNILGLSFSPNGNYIACAIQDLMFETPSGIWEVKSGRRLVSFEKPIFVYSGQPISYHPSGDYVAACDDSKVCILGVQSGQVIKTLEGHSDQVRVLAFNQGGTYLASGSRDGTIRIWDTAVSSPTFGQSLNVLEPKINCQEMCINDTLGLNALAPDGNGTLHDWLIRRGARDISDRATR